MYIMNTLTFGYLARFTLSSASRIACVLRGALDKASRRAASDDWAALRSAELGWK